MVETVTCTSETFYLFISVIILLFVFWSYFKLWFYSQPGIRWLRLRFSGRETIQEVELVEGRGYPGQKTWILKFGGIDTVEQVSLVHYF